MSRERENPVQPLEEGFTVSGWRVFPHANRLERANGDGRPEEVRVNAKAMQVLLMLAASPGRFVSKDELLSTVWSGRFVTEDVLTGAVRILRRAMHDDAKNPQIIETRKGSGYRMIADVKLPSQGDAGRKRFALGIAAAALALAAGAVIAFLLMTWKPYEQPIVAVLPFMSLTDDERGIYVASAMTDALILDLAQRNRFRVISRTSILPYADQSKPLPVIARELNAHYLIEGSILLEGDALRISAQLIDAANDTHLWASRYDRRFDDILAIQSEVANRITHHIAGIVAPPPEEQRHGLPAESLDRLLKARYLLAQEEIAPAQEALELFEQLLEAHPEMADAHLGQAEAKLFLFKQYALPPEALADAKRSAHRAIELDPDRAEAYRCLGQIVFLDEWDFAGAESAYRHAITLNSNDTVARRRYAWLLVSLRRYDEALEQIGRIKMLDPHYYASADGALLLVLSGEHSAAIDELERLNRTAPNRARTLRTLAWAYWAAGRYDDSTAALIDSRKVAGNSTAEQRELDSLFRAEGRAAVYRYLLGADVFPSPVAKAALYAQLGDYEAALDLLNRALSNHDPQLLFVNARPEFTPLRDDPRFRALVAQIKQRP